VSRRWQWTGVAFVLVAFVLGAQVPRMVEAQAPALDRGPKPVAQAPDPGPKLPVPMGRFFKAGGRFINIDQVAYMSFENKNVVLIVFAGGAPLKLTGQEAAAMTEYMASMMNAPG
jgi:hypothetical protein